MRLLFPRPPWCLGPVLRRIGSVGQTCAGAGAFVNDPLYRDLLYPLMPPIVSPATM
jgi:hypothetical protein